MFAIQATLVGLFSAILGGHYVGIFTLPTRSKSTLGQARWECHPFLPKLFVETPPPADHALIATASKLLDNFLSARFSKGDIDSLSVAVITSEGPLFEKNWGVMRGNESGSLPTTSDSMYRIASVSKLFTVLEGLILEQKHALSWCVLTYCHIDLVFDVPSQRDDPVEKYLPDFKYRLDSLNPDYPAPSQDEAPITLFQLASHMSGLGRDWPPGTVFNWPYSLEGGGPPPTNGLSFPSHESLYAAAANHHLTSPPFNYPAYSNTGIGLLGLALVAANRKEFGDEEPGSYADLINRDIFDPLGLNGSHFLTTDENKHLIVVPSKAPEVAVRAAIVCVILIL